MKIYKHKITGNKITEDSYGDLYSFEKRNYEYLGQTTGNSSFDHTLLSGVIGYVTNSGLLGGLLGGNLLGGVLGDALNDDDDNPIW